MLKKVQENYLHQKHRQKVEILLLPMIRDYRQSSSNNPQSCKSTPEAPYIFPSRFSLITTKMSFRIAVQPPRHVQKDTFLSHPMALDVRLGNNRQEMSDIFAVATLISDESESIDNAIRGSYAETAQNFYENRARMSLTHGYIIFDKLKVKCIGIFRLRITVLSVANSRVLDGAPNFASGLAQLESELIKVQEEGVEAQSPSKVPAIDKFAE